MTAGLEDFLSNTDVPRDEVVIGIAAGYALPLSAFGSLAVLRLK